MSQPEEPAFLIVDDNEMNREILRRHLGRQGYSQIFTAENGKQALDMIESQKFDLILLDIMMPEVNGFQVLEQLKSNSHVNHVPVIVVSALDEIDSIVKCIGMGAEDYLTKPYNPILLRARVTACIEKKILRDQEHRYRHQLEEANQKLAEVNRQLERLSNLDGLTSIANRRHFDNVLEREWKASQREGSYLSLVIFDVDFFKQYNDSYGHLAGDDCLRRVAQLAESSLSRPRDLAARYGGEEFAIILPNTDLKGAENIALKICSGVMALEIPHESSQISQYITVSIGVSSMIPSSDTTPNHLIADADKALFQAKQGGRNQVRIWQLGDF